jgi:hypothetical protein
MCSLVQELVCTAGVAEEEDFVGATFNLPLADKDDDGAPVSVTAQVYSDGKKRIVTLGLGTRGRHRMDLERWTNPKKINEALTKGGTATQSHEADSAIREGRDSGGLVVGVRRNAAV